MIYLAYKFFADNNICMEWSEAAEVSTPPIFTIDFYLRFIGIIAITKDNENDNNNK
jgi:hypothetical protein